MVSDKRRASPSPSTHGAVPSLSTWPWRKASPTGPSPAAGDPSRGPEWPQRVVSAGFQNRKASQGGRGTASCAVMTANPIPASPVPDDPYRQSLQRILTHIGTQHPEFLDIAVEMARRRISERIRTGADSIIRCGPFRGMKLSSSDSHWGGSDKGSMILGLYEKEILDLMASLGSATRPFINLGAAGGYYGIGMLVGRLCSTALCFELDEKGRALIRESAEANRVGDRIQIHGTAARGFQNTIPEENLRDAIILIDIEGHEVELLDQETFRQFRSCDVIVELHPWVPEYTNGFPRMVQASSGTHTVVPLETGARNLARLPGLEDVPDSSRWLLCSEGRPFPMTWLHFRPRSGSLE